MINNLYNNLEKIDSDSLFYYLLIIITTLFIFNKHNVKLNNIMGLIIGIIIVIFYHQKKKKSSDKKDIQHKIKIKKINENLNISKIEKYDNIVDFIFSIKELYYYNEIEFINMIKYLEQFFEVYENTKIDNTFFTQYYHISESLAYNSFNSLHSIIHSIGNYPILINKLHKACQILHDILNIYLNDIYDLSKKKILLNGLNIHTMPLYNGPKEYNLYDNKKYTYKLY